MNRNLSSQDTDNLENEEYNTLRQEILDAMKGETTVITLTFSATVLTLGFNLARTDPKIYVFLLPLIILGAGIIQITQGHLGIIQTATYIRLVLEKGSDKKWETWMSFLRNQKTREIQKKGKGRLAFVIAFLKQFRINFITNFYIVRHHVWISILAGWICIGYSVVYSVRQFHMDLVSYSWLNRYSIFYLAVFICFAIAWLYISLKGHSILRPANISEYENEHEKNLLNWLNFDRKFLYEHENYPLKSETVLIEITKLKEELNSLKNEIKLSNVLITLSSGNTLKINTEKINAELLTKMKVLLPGYNIIIQESSP